MTVRKVLLLSLVKTKAVVGAGTRSVAGIPAVDELVGEGLLVRGKDLGYGVLVPPEELEVTEVDFNEDVFRQPLTYALNSGTLVAVSDSVSNITAPGTDVKVTLAAAATVSDKAVFVVIEAGAGQAPLKFSGKTTAGATDVTIPVSGVPKGSRMAFASADGYVSLCISVSFP